MDSIGIYVVFDIFVKNGNQRLDYRRSKVGKIIKRIVGCYFSSLLITGWILGIFIIAAIIRFGVSAESLAWGAIFTLAPLSAVYYPVETLPEWIRWLSLSFPQTYVFEGMRDVLFNNNFNLNYFVKSLALNGVYTFIAIIVFLVINI